MFQKKIALGKYIRNSAKINCLIMSKYMKTLLTYTCVGCKIYTVSTYTKLSFFRLFFDVWAYEILGERYQFQNGGQDGIIAEKQNG